MAQPTTTTNTIEQYFPYVKYNGGIATDLPIYINNDITITGTASFAGSSFTNLTATGNTTLGDGATDTLAVTGVTTFTETGTGNVAVTISGASTTVDEVLISGTGAHASAKGELRVTNSGATAAGGAVFIASATGTPAAATGYLAFFDNSGITATNNPIAVQVTQIGTAAAINVSAAIQTTHFRKIFGTNTATIWVSDGTTANGALTGTAGDLCLNAGSNKPEYCTGTTSWTALV